MSEQVDVVMDDLLAGRVLGFLPRQRLKAGLLETGKHLARLDAHCFSHPLTIREQSGDHGDFMPAGLQEQRCTVAVEPVSDGRDTEA